MIAFISYSLRESEKYRVTQLAVKLGENGFTPTARPAPAFDALTISAVRQATLFLGLVTAAGPEVETEWVEQELAEAKSRKTPALLLLEDKARVAPWVADYQNTVRFNRKNPGPAMAEVQKRLDLARQAEAPEKSNTLAWLLGGRTALALLALLREKKPATNGAQKRNQVAKPIL